MVSGHPHDDPDDNRVEYDDLDEAEQTIVRAQWEERMERVRQSLDFAADFAAAGELYTELDSSGNLVTIDPTCPDA